jgi:hypothetical protein
MSSATSVYAQIPGRVKFFLATADLSGYVVADLNTIVTADITGSNKFDIPPASLLKDLGRQIVVVDPVTGAHEKTYRQVQVMGAAQAEGVHGSAPDVKGSYYSTGYVLVSSAGGTGVRVVRTG